MDQSGVDWGDILTLDRSLSSRVASSGDVQAFMGLTVTARLLGRVTLPFLTTLPATLASENTA